MKPRGPEHRRTWSPDLAYVAGLLATDDNLSPDGRHICFVSCDIQLIQTVADIRRLTNRVGRVPDEFFPDFLRGHLDGDGSITVYTDRYNTRLSSAYVYQRLYIRFLSASRPHVDWLQGTIRRLRGLIGHVVVRRFGIQGRVPSHALKFAKKDSISLLRWMYYTADVPCLARKRAIAEPFLTGDLRDFRHPRQSS